MIDDSLSEKIYDLIIDKNKGNFIKEEKLSELISNDLSSQVINKIINLIDRTVDANLKIGALERLSQLSGNQQIKFKLAELYKLTGNEDQALRCYHELCQNSQNPWHYIRYSELLLKRNTSGKAIDLMLHAQSLASNALQNGLINKILGEAYDMAGSKNKAFKHLIAYLKQEPGDTKTYFKIAEIISDQVIDKNVLDHIRTQRDIPIHILKRYYDNLEDWRKIRLTENDENVRWFKDRYKLKLEEPKGINNEIHYSLEGSPSVHRWESFVVELENAKCAANNSFSYVEDKNRNIIDSVSIGGSNILRAFKDFTDSKYLPGKTAFLSQYFGAINYCHWILDILPRVGLLEKCAYPLGEIDYFVFNNYKSPFQIDSLNRLGIDQDRIVTSDQSPLITGDVILVPSLHMHPGNSGSPWVAQFLQDKFLESQSSKKRRIYINRMGVDKRRVINELELIDMLEKKFGFENITMHEHDVFEQAKIANEAEIIVGPHGAALTNIVFCRPGTKFVEIFSPVYGTWTYFITARMAELDYHNFIGEDFDNSLSVFDTQKYPNSYFGQKDIMVNIPKLESLLEKIIY